MLLILTVIPLILGLVVVILSAVRRLRLQPAYEESQVEAEAGRQVVRQEQLQNTEARNRKSEKENGAPCLK